MSQKKVQISRAMSVATCRKLQAKRHYHKRALLYQVMEEARLFPFRLPTEEEREAHLLDNRADGWLRAYAPKHAR